MSQETKRNTITWESVLYKDINLQVMLNTLPTKGHLVYEYNPFRNYRLNENKYYYKGSYYTKNELEREFNFRLKEETKIKQYIKIDEYKIYLSDIHTSLIVTALYMYDESQEGESGGQYYEFYQLQDLGLDVDTSNNWTWIETGEEVEYPPILRAIVYKGETIELYDLEIKEDAIAESFWVNDLNIDVTDIELYEKGQLVDFDTDEFNFSLEHPVHIIPQYSYDGSVNLILNDGYNPPRLINSRFSATGRNTYEIVDRKGNNDTNIYDQGEQFEIDTSLYKIVNGIPKVEFLGTRTGGAMKVGNYHFYFKLSDADGNETDFVAESGLVSVFIGENTYSSVHTGTKNENSTKQVEFKLTNVDSAYDYITVYYSRYTAEAGDNFVTQYAKIDKKYLRTASKLVITGFEDIVEVSAADINLHYNLVNAACTSAVCQNMLFMANVHKQDIPYEELQDLSLRILPCLKHETYNPEIDHNYNINDPKNSYINSKFIYDKTGYWDNELYRFGIVYILPNGELTPVFNVRGGIGIGENIGFSKIPIFDENNTRKYVQYNESTNYLIGSPNAYEGYNNNYWEKNISENPESVQYENIKGVCSFKPVVHNGNHEIYSINFYASEEVRNELSKYVKGYFFVRQTRIPLMLAQGVTIGIDNIARTPTIPTAGGMLTTLSNVLEKTHVQTEDIDGVNYISEGFLKRYGFKFKQKSSSVWKKIGAYAGIAATIVATVAVSIITFGAGALVAAPIAGLVVSATSTAAAAATITAAQIGVTMLAVTAASAAATAASVAIVAGLQEGGYAIERIGAKRKLNGKKTKAPDGYKIVETDDSRKLTKNYEDRIIIKDPSNNKVQGIICPDYTVNPAYFNQIFIGNKHLIKTDSHQSCMINSNSKTTYFENRERHFFLEKYTEVSNTKSIECKVMAVPDNIKCTGIDNIIFRSRAGEAEEAWRYEFIGEEIIDDVENKKINSDIVRGAYGPYLAFLNNDIIGPAQIVNIYIPGYSENNMTEYVDIRMHDNSPYFAITDRKSIRQETSGTIIGDKNTNYEIVENAYRGDCYICQYTQRIIRNFNDPTAPYNDDFVDVNTWRNNYNTENEAKYSEINLGDVNAVPLGMWLTFQLRSSNNLNIRTLDGSNVDETAMVGHPKGYFPHHPMSVEGVYKHSESQIYNKGFTKSVSERWNFETPDQPYIKNWYGTRIMYSDIHVNDAFKNGYRVFKGQNYRDYTREYGEIVKLVSLESNLLCVFEHGIALIPVNERAVAGQGAGGNVYINTSNVLPENPRIISDMFGSQWAESILKVPGKTGDSPQYVYGVDTVAKKIWRTDGQTLQCISDMKVQEFLNNNITLGERELTPKIGIRNVKTHYNAFKRDVMFTFYDNTYGFEEKVWNLCWNELLQKFVTFYSWVPSYMENINNIPFSFDRNTSKWIAKLGTSHTENSFADGITLTSVIMDKPNYNIPVEYISKNGKIKKSDFKAKRYLKFDSNMNKYIPNNESGEYTFIGGLSLNNRILPSSEMQYYVKYSLERDNYQNYKDFFIHEVGTCLLKDFEDAKFDFEIPVYGLYYKGDISDFYSELYYRNQEGNSYADVESHKKNYVEYNDGIPFKLKSHAKRKPIFKNLEGKRVNLKREEMLNPDKIIRLLNIKAEISIIDTENVTLSDTYYNSKAGYKAGTTLIDSGYYESVVAITPNWNLQFLSTDFWKHGQAGLIDIVDDILPTYWYGKQHPFEFECIVVNDPSTHKIFRNLELVANKAKPESFHYEIIGESYDFAKDKVNMYFRQEAKKALWQYNGADICYDRNFLKVQPRQQNKSADLPHTYYARQDTINEIEDTYISITSLDGHDYRHLSGAEIVYYPTRQEYRIWNHAQAITLDDLDQDNARSLITANCQYLEDRWKISINPILVCYKNEGQVWKGKEYSTWTNSNRPPLTIMNSPIPNDARINIAYNEGNVEIPSILSELGYSAADVDLTNWLNEVSIYGTSFGEAQNRRELDLKDKFMKVRIRYSGEELAIIDFLNTIYSISAS